MAGLRLDLLVVERGLAETRARAQALILGGGIHVDGRVVTKPSTPVDSSVSLSLAREPLPYVSRGGIKLRHALDHFNVSTLEMIAADIGASTGGFTDVMLQAGAKRVYAIDVGYGQLAWSLRNDPRVVVMERTNARHLQALPELVDVVAVDVSFISLRHILPAVRRLLRPNGQAIILIKPQFEAGRVQVGKKGVVRDPLVRADVIRRVLAFAREEGFAVEGLERSPIVGPAGNVEFLALLSLSAEHSVDWEELIPTVVAPDTGPALTDHGR